MERDNFVDAWASIVGHFEDLVEVVVEMVIKVIKTRDNLVWTAEVKGFK
jgi:hypothetical protein